MKTQKTLSKSLYFWLLLISVSFFSSASAQSTTESTEDTPDATTVEEGGSATADTPGDLAIQPRTVSSEDLNELQAAQLVLSRADAVVQHIITRIITDYGINTQTETLNIKTGLITPRPGAAYLVPDVPGATTTQQ